MGENITFSCTTSHSFLIWEVIFADRTIRPMTHLFLTSDTPGRLFSESAHGYFQMISSKKGILDSILVVYTSGSLENAVIECEGTETQRLTFRLACKRYCRCCTHTVSYFTTIATCILINLDAPGAPTGMLLSEEMYNNSGFASVMLSWDDPIGRIDNYSVRISIGSSLSQQFSVVMHSQKLDQIPYNENVTIGISAVNCVAEGEEVSISFIVGKAFSP